MFQIYKNALLHVRLTSCIFSHDKEEMMTTQILQQPNNPPNYSQKLFVIYFVNYRFSFLILSSILNCKMYRIVHTVLITQFIYHKMIYSKNGKGTSKYISYLTKLFDNFQILRKYFDGKIKRLIVELFLQITAQIPKIYLDVCK